ncbi:class I SAM-dependent methyltransferase [Geminocystis sp. NIES-3709]|uniref:class I SAM-dependent methyltransferase n=1 Tax=Geminocystis sp. NIES-3709 TaxID=1617448 RepID=UPI0005FC6C10|nr:class I SAM-dependent methyltransferase [Geminocystis sp. NIES-3709]BAQ65208.1 UbiE/COQ5 methyltransferase [Geminocystis sp. NIES-3709]
MERDNFFDYKQLFFDRWSNFYDVIFTTIFYQAIHKRLLEYVTLSNNNYILDLGCGTGKLINRLGDKFPEIKGIGADLSPKMLRQARQANRHHPRFIFTVANACNLPFANNQFDAIFNTISFLHYPNPQLVFREISRVLKPQGYFYLADYITKNEVNAIPFSPGGIRFYTKESRQKLGENVGLVTIGHYYLFNGVILTIFHNI